MGWFTDYVEKPSLIDYAANRMKLAQKPSPFLWPRAKPRAASAGHGFSCLLPQKRPNGMGTFPASMRLYIRQNNEKRCAWEHGGGKL